MVILAVLLAVFVTYSVWIRRPEQRMITRMTAEIKLSAAFAKPGEAIELNVTVHNEKSLAVPLLRVDVNLPDELVFTGNDAVPRQRTHLCTLRGKESTSFAYTVIAQREGKAVIETPELIVYGITGAVIANNAESRGKPGARLRITLNEEE